ncbi:hypothetical protein [Nocardioides sp. L-11A]|uniref:hypothetical protein n=1 Tax=Nocardioides sp. L-11A TaxID=3043848 RepID=UPI00249C2ED6|nr:hypothetical protein QJ852_13850 [Nocardioides sp. L-11A]
MAPPQWKQYSPDDSPDPEEGPARPRTPTPYRPPKQPRPPRTVDERTVRKRSFHPVGLLIAAGGVAVALGAPVILSVAGSEDSPAAEEPQTDRGFDALVAALREETGSTLARNAVIYPDYAVVDVPYRPDDPADERELVYHWDGELGEPGKDTGDDVVFDLADVDSAVLDGLCPQVEALVEDPETCYLMISGPDPEDSTPAWISVYASNDFRQTAYVEFGLDGTVVEVHPAS